ncbi:probable assembly chaperone of rpl4 [Alosa alosa]|uniref:probable assembly chaperone of rpl4 n=1 Tax=Alosa alosa TaxID=278164 RepID=UPI0020152B37|nr:probable assembly chaperone of rpl4 [Alosa alosa]
MGGQAKSKKKSKSKKTRSNGVGAGLVAFTAQDRIKVRMQEKAKKKTAEKYTVEQLLEKVEESMDNFDLPMARLFCQRALDIESTNLEVLDMMGNICAELGEVDKAKQVFLKAVELSPEQGHSKYMYLGQIHTGQEAIDYFRKGIEIMTSTLDTQQPSAASAEGASACGEEDEPAVSGKDLSVAFCSMAEIYFTDLCFEEAFCARCKEAIAKALEYDPVNAEALQLMASYLFSTQNMEEGKDYLKRSVSSWLPSLRPQTEQLAAQQEEESEQSGVPPYESRITTAKLLIEAEEPEMVMEVCEGLLEEDDEVVQVWYLLGWVCYLQRDKPEEAESFRDSARTYLTRAKKLYVKLCCDDPPMLEHVEQLLSELRPEGASAADDDEDDEDGPPIDDIADDFIHSSDEEENAMEH